MKFNIKTFVTGALVGMFVTMSSSVFADGTVEKIQAYLNKGMSVTLDGTKLNLKKPVAVINGNSYIPLSEIGTTLGKDVIWNNKTKTIELKSKEAIVPPVTSTPPINITPSTEVESDSKNTVYYNVSDIETSEYFANFIGYDDDYKAIIIVQGVTYHVKQETVMDKSRKVYGTEETFLQYLTKDQLSKFQKYTFNSIERKATPIN